MWRMTSGSAFIAANGARSSGRQARSRRRAVSSSPAIAVTVGTPAARSAASPRNTRAERKGRGVEPLDGTLFLVAPAKGRPGVRVARPHTVFRFPERAAVAPLAGCPASLFAARLRVWGQRRSNTVSEASRVGEEEPATLRRKRAPTRPRRPAARRREAPRKLRA